MRLTVRHIDIFLPETIDLQICNSKILVDIKNYVHTQQTNFYVPYKDKLLNTLIKNYVFLL